MTPWTTSPSSIAADRGWPRLLSRPNWQLASIAVETGKIVRQLTGQKPRVAMLSFSTKGSSKLASPQKIAAATALARRKAQEELIDAEMRHEINSILSVLDEREQHIMRKRFGFDGEDTYVLQQIGEELNISRERVRQIEAQALRKLRSAARKRRLRDYLQG